MLKLAYMLGAAEAMAEEGIEKDAFPMPVERFVLRHPLLTRTLGLSALGGVTGAALGDPDKMGNATLLGALTGAGVGAGLHAGELATLGEYGRKAKEVATALRGLELGAPLPKGFFEKYPAVSMRDLKGALARLRRLAPRVSKGRAIGAGLGGLGAYGLGSAITNELE